MEPERKMIKTLRQNRILGIKAINSIDPCFRLLQMEDIICCQRCVALALALALEKP